MTTGEKLRQLRGSRSQEQIAQAVGVSTSAIGMYETDQRIPRHEIMKKLSSFFDVTVDELFFTDTHN